MRAGEPPFTNDQMKPSKKTSLINHRWRCRFRQLLYIYRPAKNLLMEEIVAAIASLFQAWKNASEDRIEKLPQSGSDRIYFRIYAGKETYIGTFNINIKENETFF